MNIPSVIAPPQMLTYINLASADPIKSALAKNTEEAFRMLDNLPAEKVDYAYAPGKWTVKQMLQHMIDSERVFAFRALWFSRDPQKVLPGFEENGWAANAPVENREWPLMVEEFKALRTSTRLLIESIPEQYLDIIGEADGKPLSVAAACYVCAGHVAHHLGILGTRYGVSY